MDRPQPISRAVRTWRLARARLIQIQQCPPPDRSNVEPVRRRIEGGIVMSEFVYLYRSGEQEHRQSMGSPEQIQKTMQKWMAWMKELGDKGHIKDPGQPLERTGKVVKGKQKTVTDGPYAETKDIVGGYTLVEAKGLAQPGDA